MTNPDSPNAGDPHSDCGSGGTLLPTKLFAPAPRADRVARPRLSAALDGFTDGSILLVSAPAGYGKSTFVGAWLAESKIPSAWLSLDEGDNDPVRFLNYLSAALAPLTPGADPREAALLPGIRPAQFEERIQLLVGGWAASPDPSVLVLDDVHVIRSEDTQRLLALLVERLPPRMRLAILTRTDPALPLARLRAAGRLTDIRADQLRFTRAETAAFLRESMRLPLSDGDLAAMEARTEGWIAGLQLAALSMQNDPDIGGFLAAFAGTQRYIMDYLTEEVLKRQPRRVNDFLLQTSILDRLCGPLCEAVVSTEPGEPGAGQNLLEQLEERNLFLVPLDRRRRWFRYHHLFADVLRRRLESQAPGSVPAIRRRASDWYERNGFIAEAIQQAVLAGDADRAADLIERNGCLLLISGEVATFRQWTDAVDFRAESRPWLAIQKAWALALTGEVDRVEPTLRDPDRLLAPLEPSLEVRTMQGTIAAARAFCANERGDTPAAAGLAHQALELLPDCSSISQSIRSVSTSLLGDASWINGDLAEAARAYAEANRIGRAAGNRHMVIIADTNLADISVGQGRLRRAEELYLRTLEAAVRPDGQTSPLAGGSLAGLGRTAYEQNRLEDAGRRLRACAELGRMWGDPGLRAEALALRARLDLARGRPEAAREAAREAEDLAPQSAAPSRRLRRATVDLARYWLAQGEAANAERLVPLADIPSAGTVPYPREPDWILKARILLSRGEFAAARELSARILAEAERGDRLGSIIECLVIQALACRGKKEAEDARAALERAVDLARTEGFVRVFLDEGGALAKLLCQVRSSRTAGADADALLANIGGQSGAQQPSLDLLSEPLSARETEVLQLIEAGRSNQEIAAALVISLPTVKRHISNIYNKMGVTSRTQAVSIGKELKIIR